SALAFSDTIKKAPGTPAEGAGDTEATQGPAHTSGSSWGILARLRRGQRGRHGDWPNRSAGPFGFTGDTLHLGEESMTSELQTAANGRNATLSTGPTTDGGKARSSKNALRHGLLAGLPVLPGECADDWQAHRDGIVRSLAPAGGLETALAERVALSLWRLRRVASYETAVTALGIEEVAEEMQRQAED